MKTIKYAVSVVASYVIVGAEFAIYVLEQGLCRAGEHMWIPTGEGDMICPRCYRIEP